MSWAPSKTSTQTKKTTHRNFISKGTKPQFILSKINWLPPVPTRHYSVREERSYLAMVREMTQCLKVLATLSEDQCSVPSNHIRWLSVRHLMPCSCSSANCTRAHIDTSIHINKNLLKIEKWISNLRSTGSMKI